jgi:hypothetical protein
MYSTSAHPLIRYYIPEYIAFLVMCIVSINSYAVGLAYIPNDNNGTVAVVNTDSDRVVYKYKNITNGNGAPFGVGISRTHNNVFLTHPGAKEMGGSLQSITMIQPPTRNAKPKIIETGPGAYGIAVSKSGWSIYEVNAESGSLTVLSAAGNIKSIFDLKLKSPSGISSSIVDGKELVFVTESKGNTVAVIDPVYGILKSRIAVGKYPIGIVTSKDGKKAYVSNYDDGSVTSIDIIDQKADKTLRLDGRPYGITMSPDSNEVLVATQNLIKKKNGRVYILKADTLEVVSNVLAGVAPIGISSIATRDGGYKAYVANHDSNNLSVIKCKNLKCSTRRNIKMPGAPSAFGNFIAEYPKRYGYFIIKELIHSQKITKRTSHKTAINYRRSILNSVVTEGEPGLLQSFFSETIDDFAGSQLLQLLGIDSAPASQQSIDTILTQLNAIETTLVSMETTLNSVFKDITDILSVMSEAEVSQIDNITSSTGTGWAQFQNSFQTSSNPLSFLTLNEIGNGSQASTAAINSLSLLLTDDYLASLANLANQASNYGGQTVLSPYLTAANSILTENISEALNQGDNIMNEVGTWQPPGQSQPLSLTIFDTYNNSLLNEYVNLMLALQRIYTIEASVLYLQAYLPNQFGGLVLAEPTIGRTTAENYAANAATLLNIYTQRVDSLEATFAKAFVTDSGGSLPNPPAKTGSLLTIDGSWNENTNLYVWQGILPEGTPGYSGAWDGSSLTVQNVAANDAINYSLNISKNCYSESGYNPVVSFWNIQGWTPQLQCLPSNPVSSDGSFSSPSLSTYFGRPDPNANFYFTFSSITANVEQKLISNQYPPIIVSQPTSYYTSTAAGSGFSGNVAIVAPNGFAGQYLIGGQVSGGNTFVRDWNINISCPNTGNCYYLTDTQIASLGGICLAGNYISLSGSTNGNSVKVTYAGTCPPPANVGETK